MVSIQFLLNLQELSLISEFQPAQNTRLIHEIQNKENVKKAVSIKKLTFFKEFDILIEKDMLTGVSKLQDTIKVKRSTFRFLRVLSQLFEFGLL